MTESQLCDNLISNYTEQYKVYQSLLGSLESGLLSIASSDIPKWIALLEARNRDFDAVKKLDKKIISEKAEWETTGKNYHSLSAETLRTLLSNIKRVIGQVLEANKKLEERVGALTKKL